ncbi:MAG: exonuclease subunit SbcD [Pedobacter sp.]|nr:MAG: exonuclease subunit SbcD [Pedobacter sp.]
MARLPEQILVLSEIIAVADREDADVILIAGDLFDNFNPSSESIELFYKTLKRLSNNGNRPVIAIAGNHDSPDRIEAPDPLARACGIIFAGYPHSTVELIDIETGVSVQRSEPGFVEIKLPKYDYPLRLILTPYANEYRLKTFLGVEDAEVTLRDVLEKFWKNLADTYCDDKGVNILMTHLYMMKKGAELLEEPEDEKPILHVGGAQVVYSENVPSQIQYVALGHLHRFHQIDKLPCPMVYSSSPLAYSFSEANQEKYVVLLDALPHTAVTYQKIALTEGKKLLRKKFYGTEEAVIWLKENPDILVELTLAADDYLKADERKQLFQAHDGIVTLIPEVTTRQGEIQQANAIDLNQNMEELFLQYFKSRHGQHPNQDLLDLFKEVRAEQDKL